jgi:hypothetical protein
VAASGPAIYGHGSLVKRYVGPRERIALIPRRQVVAELTGPGHEVRHARSHHAEARLDHGRVEAGAALRRLALAREPFDLATPGGRLARVRPVPELIADEIWDVTASPLGLLTLRIVRGQGRRQ